MKKLKTQYFFKRTAEKKTFMKFATVLFLSCSLTISFSTFAKAAMMPMVAKEAKKNLTSSSATFLLGTSNEFQENKQPNTDHSQDFLETMTAKNDEQSLFIEPFILKQSDRIKGSCSLDAKYVRVSVDGTNLPMTEISTPGNISYFIDGTITNEKQVVELSIFDSNLNPITSEMVLILRDTENSFRVNPVKAGVDSRISGTINNPEIKFISIEINGQDLGNLLIESNSFSYFISDKIKQISDEVFIIGYDSSGNIVGRQKVNLLEPQGEIIIPNEFVIGTDDKVIGTTTGDIYLIKLFVIDSTGKEEEGESIPVRNNSFTYDARNIIHSSTKKAVMKGFSYNGSLISEKEVTLVQAQAEIEKIESFVYGRDKNIVGVVSGNASYIDLYENGTSKGMKPIVDGKIFYPFIPASKDSKIIIKVYDKNFEELATKNVSIEHIETAIDSVKSIDIINDTNLEGSFHGTIAYVKVEGINYTSKSYDVKDNNISLPLSELSLNPTNDYKIIAYNSYDQVVDEKEIVINTVKGSIQEITPFELGKDSKVDVTLEGNVSRLELWVNDKKMSVAGVTGSQASYYIGKAIKLPTDKAKLIAYNNYGEVLSEKEIVINTVKGSIQEITPFELGKDSKVDVTLEGNVSRLELWVNDKKMSVVGVTGSQASYYIGKAIKLPTDKAKLIAYSNYGEVLSEKEIVINTVKGSIQEITPFELGKDSKVDVTLEGNVSRLELWVNDKKMSVVGVTGSQASYYIGKAIKLPTDKAKLIAYSNYGEVLSEKEIVINTVKGSIQEITPFELGKDSKVDVTLEGNVSRLELWVNDKKMSVAGVTGSQASYYIGKAIKLPTDKAKLIAYNNYGEVLSEKEIVINTVKGSIQEITPFELGKDSKVDVTLEGNVSRLELWVNDKKMSVAGVTGSQASYYIGKAIKLPTDKAKLIAYNNYGEVLSEKEISIKTTI